MRRRSLRAPRLRLARRSRGGAEQEAKGETMIDMKAAFPRTAWPLFALLDQLPAGMADADRGVLFGGLSFVVCHRLQDCRPRHHPHDRGLSLKRNERIPGWSWTWFIALGRRWPPAIRSYRRRSRLTAQSAFIKTGQSSVRMNSRHLWILCLLRRARVNVPTTDYQPASDTNASAF